VKATQEMVQSFLKLIERSGFATMLAAIGTEIAAELARNSTYTRSMMTYLNAPPDQRKRLWLTPSELTIERVCQTIQQETYSIWLERELPRIRAAAGQTTTAAAATLQPSLRDALADALQRMDKSLRNLS